MDDKINVDKQLLEDIIKNFQEEYADRSFSGRHPELGKMKKCQICGLRHRSSRVCQERILVGTDQKTQRGVYGSAMFQKKRKKMHHSSKLLQLVQLTQQLFPAYNETIIDPQAAMEEARTDALRSLRSRRKRMAKAVRQRQKTSRRINRGS